MEPDATTKEEEYRLLAEASGPLFPITRSNVIINHYMTCPISWIETDHFDPPLSRNLAARLYFLLLNFKSICAGKMRVLAKMLEKLKADGHRVLIFSRYTSMLDIIEDYITFKVYCVF